MAVYDGCTYLVWLYIADGAMALAVGLAVVSTPASHVALPKLSRRGSVCATHESGEFSAIATQAQNNAASRPSEGRL